MLSGKFNCLLVLFYLFARPVDSVPTPLQALRLRRKPSLLTDRPTAHSTLHPTHILQSTTVSLTHIHRPLICPKTRQPARVHDRPTDRSIIRSRNRPLDRPPERPSERLSSPPEARLAASVARSTIELSDRSPRFASWTMVWKSGNNLVTAQSDIEPFFNVQMMQTLHNEYLDQVQLTQASHWPDYCYQCRRRQHTANCSY